MALKQQLPYSLPGAGEKIALLEQEFTTPRPQPVQNWVMGKMCKRMHVKLHLHEWRALALTHEAPLERAEGTCAHVSGALRKSTVPSAQVPSAHEQSFAHECKYPLLTNEAPFS